MMIVGIVIILILVICCIRLKTYNNHLQSYVNETLSNLMKPMDGDLKENKLIIEKTLEDKKISTNDLESLTMLFADIVHNLNELEGLETHMAVEDNAGSETKDLLFKIEKYLASIKGEEQVQLNSEQLESFKKISLLNQSLLTLFKKDDVLHSDFDIRGDKWINILRKMDEVLVRNNYAYAF